MRASLLSLFALAAVLLARPAASHACSLAFDWADPPAQEQPYDETLAPPPPEVIAAEVYHHEDQGSSGCGGVTSTCGDYSALTVDLAAQPAHERVRVTFPDGSTAYARPRVAYDDTIYFSLPWSLGRGQPEPITLEVVDDQGYPSLAVEVVPTSDADDATGCSAGNASGPAPATLILAAAVLLALRRRRAHH